MADSIAGYWSTTSDGSWIIDRQNAVWSGPRGIGADWRDPWSAAFVSWVMCESGLGDANRFQRAIAHHRYIDQAIEARGDKPSQAAFVAYDVGEFSIEPGDLLCLARRSGPWARTGGPFSPISNCVPIRWGWTHSSTLRP